MSSVRFRGVLFALLLLLPWTIRFEDGGSKNFPVTRVVWLLKDMHAQLARESEADEEVYEKHSCWCQTNDKETTGAINDAQAHIRDLDSTIEKKTAESARLKTEILGLEQELVKYRKALDEATALRKKQEAEFDGEEKEMIESIRALQAAIVVLSKHHGGVAALSKVAAAVHSQIVKHADLLEGTITPRQRHAIASLAQQGGRLAPRPKQAYAPQSGEIFGILQQMKATFEENLSVSQKEELSSQTAFADVKAAKDEQIRAAQAALTQKTQQVADSDQTLAQSQQDKEDTVESLSADEKFIIDLRSKCSMTDSEWEDRKKTRQDEIAAVSQAISILHSDDARDLFSKVFNPTSFLQEANIVESSRRGHSSKAAFGAGDQKLSSLSTAVRLDPFPRVKQAIDDMILQLQRDKQDEVAHKDSCIFLLNENERNTAAKMHGKAAAESEITGMEIMIENLNATIGMLTTEIADLNVQKVRAAEDRALQKKEFQSVVSDQREAQQVLTQAVTALKAVYQLNTTMLVQQVTQPNDAPLGFGSYEKQGASTHVILLLEQIIGDARALEADAVHGNAKAQEAYDNFVVQTDAVVAAKQNSIADKELELSFTAQALTEQKSSFNGLMSELEGLANAVGTLHTSCDFLLRNFEVRQQARDEELGALRQAKAALSGMKLA